MANADIKASAKAIGAFRWRWSETMSNDDLTKPYNPSADKRLRTVGTRNGTEATMTILSFPRKD